MTSDQPSSSTFGSRPLPFTARDLLAIGFRRQRLIVFAFLCILIAVVLMGFSRPRRYEASMKILVKRERAEPMVTAEQTPTFQTSQAVTEQEINSEIELLWSRDLHKKAVVATKLHERHQDSFWTVLKSHFQPALEDGASAEDRKIATAVLAFENWLRIEPVKKSNLIRVSYASQDPHEAVRVINALAELYLAKHLEVHRPPGAFGFFEQETARYRKELEALQKQVADHARAEGVVAVQEEKDTTLKQLTEFEASLQRTRVEVAEAGERVRALEAEAAVTPSQVTTEVREASARLLEQQRGTLLTLELKRLELLQLFQPAYPPLQEVEKQIALTREAIAASEASPILEKTTARSATREWLTTELARSRSLLPSLQARATATAQSVRVFQDKARRLDEVQTVQDNLSRDAKLAEQNYLIYARKQEEARISNELDVQRIVNVAIAEAATVPFVPAGPGKALILLVAGILAAVGSVVLAFVVDYIDPSFRTPDEVEGFLGVPVVAAIPRSGR
jgi:uncharacterized protein involved in exopolysaccharide biosynthesis